MVVACRAAVEQLSGTVTFLPSDVVGSTAMCDPQAVSVRASGSLTKAPGEADCPFAVLH